MARTTAPSGAGAPPGSGEPRPLRADPRRNRQRILEAAEEIIGKDGINVPIDAVAERAGVGVGTLYRHFPTKEALYEAIVVGRLDALTARCQASADDDPTEAFFSFLATMAEEASRKHDLMDAIGATGIDFKARCADQMAELESAIERLRQRAIESGGIRGDVSAREVMGLVIGACKAAEHAGSAPVSCRPMLGVIFDGLRRVH